MKNLIKQKLYFALIFFSVFACKEGEFSNQNRELALVEYKASMRAFIPYYRVGIMGKADPPYDNTFGTYAGDNREFSSNNYDTSKLNHEVIFDINKGETRTNVSYKLKADCSLTTKYDSNNQLQKEAQGDPDFSRWVNRPQMRYDGNNLIITFSTEAAATNPLSPIFDFATPAIKLASDFTIIENKEERYLKLKGTLRVTEFPSAEAYIKDPGGNVVFIGVNPCEGGPINLAYKFLNEECINFNIKINTDINGYFKEVEDENGWIQSISSWNSNFENKRAYN